MATMFEGLSQTTPPPFPPTGETSEIIDSGPLQSMATTGDTFLAPETVERLKIPNPATNPLVPHANWSIANEWWDD